MTAAATTTLPTTKFTGAKRDIALAATVIAAPLLIFSVGLLLLVRYNLVEVNKPYYTTIDPRFPLPELYDASSYFVYLSAGTMAFISSWSSTVALPLVGYAMLLLSYPIARSLQKRSTSNNIHTLPSPFQFGLLLNFINSGPFGSLWECIKYRWRWEGRKRNPMSPLVTRIIYLCLGTVIMGVCIIAADTWLHLTLSTVEFVRIFDEVGDFSKYSRKLSPGCINESVSQYDFQGISNRYCIVLTDQQGANGRLANATSAVQVLNNVSTEHTVATVYPRNESQDALYAFLAPLSLLSLAGKQDFSAESLAARTFCETTSQRCNLTANGNGNISYSCPDSVAESTGNVGDEWRFSTAGHGTYFNPMPYWIGIFLQDDWASPLRSDPEVASDPTGWIGFIANCTTTIYDIKYSFNDGSLSLDQAVSTNYSVGEMVMYPWFNLLATGYFALKQQVQLAILEPSIQDMTNKLADAISKITISLTSGVMVPEYTPYQQNRTTILVTRLEKAPFYTLIALNFLLGLFGIVLAGFAFASLSGDADVKGIQARLGFNGLLAQLFESGTSLKDKDKIEDLFDERDEGAGKKIAVVEHDGMVTFVACPSY